MGTPYDDVVERRDELREEGRHLRARVAEVEQELNDIDATLRVLGRMYKREERQDYRAAYDARPDDRHSVQRKPTGLPPMAAMIVASIQDANARGDGGLKPKQMTEYIAQAFWPDVQLTSVGPIAARMLKDGRLTKHEKTGLYQLPKNEAPAGATAGASELGPLSEGSLFNSPGGPPVQTREEG